MTKRLVYRPKEKSKIDTCQTKPLTVEGENPVKTEVPPTKADTVQPQAVVATPDNKKTTGKLYYIIAASFQNQTNAQNFQQKLIAQGFNSAVLVVDASSAGAIYKVSFANYENKNDALAEAKHRVESGEFPQAWVFPYKQ